jgi:hypothetical protein
MKTMSYLRAMLVVTSLITATAAHAVNDNNATTVKLQTSCTEGGVQQNNCFSSMNALVAWIEYIRLPNKDAPLQVNIGPGTFTRLALTCDAPGGYTGYISFNGAGPQQSIIAYSASGNPPFGVIEINDCTNLSFSDLKVSSGETSFGFNYGYIVWNGGGTSHWSNMVVDVGARGWSEEVCGSTKGSHYWVGSKFKNSAIASIGVAYAATCDDSWFFGSEITQTTEPRGSFGGGSAGTYTTIKATNNTEVHVYGSVIRALVPDVSPYTRNMIAVNVSSNAQVHLHGTGIDALNSGGPGNIVALLADSGGIIHANGSAYNLSSMNGTITRISNNGGHVHAPYLWEHIPSTDLVSVTGADMTTIAAGTSDGHPHFAIYDETCASKWFDTVDKACSP